MSKGIEEKNKDNDRKVTNHNNWNQLEKCMPTPCFFRGSKNKAEFEANGNKHSMLIDDDENDDEEEDEMKENKSRLKRMKGKSKNKN